MMSYNWAAMLHDFGPLIGIVLFFIWRDWKREDQLVDRVIKLEDFQRETLVLMVKETTEIIAHNTEHLDYMKALILNCHDKN